MRRFSFCIAILVVGLSATGCSCTSDTIVGTNTDGGPKSDAQSDAKSDSDINMTWDGNVGDGSNTCAQQEGMATIVNRPVDIIVVIDNSGSMSGEIAEVEVQINTSFANILDNADPPIDYRVIMLSRFGNFNAQRICVSSPLGGIADTGLDGHCDTVPAAPVNTSKFFHHSQTVDSHDALCRLLDSYNKKDEYDFQLTGFKGVLRPDAFKFILAITDDNANCSFGGETYNDLNTVMGGTDVATKFDAALRALSAADFGVDAENRNYSFWSIIAQAPYMSTGMGNYGMPVPPAEAPTVSECSPGAQNSGTGYQALSILTGGYRFPSCGTDYSDIFELMAEGVIKGSEVACEFDIPDPPMGETLDLETVQVKYSSGDTLVGKYNQVASEAACTADAFYIDGGETIKLCPDLCDLVQADEDAAIEVLFGCEIILR